MKALTPLLVAVTALAGLTAPARAQAPVPPPPLPLGVAPQPAVPTGNTIWSKLGISQQQKEFCRRKLCRKPLGEFLGSARIPLTALSGGLIGPFCPQTPSAAELADPGAVGAAAKVKQDEAGAKERRAAVRYLGTVDCHYWPEAEDALVASLRGDRNECVRLEAAWALGNGCCCTKKTIEALVIVLSCSDRDGAPKETSLRVHNAAAAALDHCLSCYAHVSTAPVEEPKKPEVLPETPATPEVPPGQTPATPTARSTDGPAAGKPAAPSAAKPAAGLPAQVAAAKRPVGPAYYERIAQQPLAAILAEARRVAGRPATVVAESPFQMQGRSVSTVLSYAMGPDGPAAGSPEPPSVQVVKAEPAPRPINLWDMLTRSDTPAGPAVAPPSAPTPAKIEVAAAPPAPPKAEVVVAPPAPAPAKIPATVTKVMPAPAQFVAVNPTRRPAPAPTPAPGSAPAGYNRVTPPAAAPAVAAKPAAEPILPPAGPAMPMPAPAPAVVAKPAAEPVLPPPSAVVGPTVPKPPAVVALPMTAPPAVTAPPPLPVPAAVVGPAVPMPTAPTPAVVALPVPAPPVPAPAVVVPPPVKAPPLPVPAVIAPPAPMPVVVAPAPAPAPVARPVVMPTVIAPADIAPVRPVVVTPRPAPVVAPVAAVQPSPAARQALDALGGRADPMDRQRAVNGLATADVQGCPELVDLLLKAAREDDTVTVRKACIRALVGCQVATPAVFAGLDALANDAVPAVRAEAVIGRGRLRMYRP